MVFSILLWSKSHGEEFSQVERSDNAKPDFIKFCLETNIIYIVIKLCLYYTITIIIFQSYDSLNTKNEFTTEGIF